MLFSVIVGLVLLAGVGLMLSLRALAITGVPVRSAEGAAVEAALDLLALREGETFCDLGCGGGQVLRAARSRAKVHVLGFELNPGAFLLAWLRSGRGSRVRPIDFRRAALGEVDAAYAYLMPGVMAELGRKLERELRSGSRFVSVDFAVPGWTASATREAGALRQPVRLYVLGEHRGPVGSTKTE